MENVVGGFFTFILTFGTAYAVAVFNIIIEEIIDTRGQLKKGTIKRPQALLLQYLRTKTTHKQQIINLLPVLPIIFALTLLPDATGSIYWNAGHSVWIFFALMLLGQIILFLKSTAAKESFNNNTLDKNVAVMAPLSLLLFVVMITTGEDQISKIVIHQEQKGMLLFSIFPVYFILSFLWFICLQYANGAGLFSERNEKLKITTHVIKAVWLIFFVTLFCSGSSVDIYIKAIAANTLGYLIFTYFSKFREDQEEKFILWEITPIALLIVIISLVIIGFK